jgi:hypothetical protein
VAVAVISVRRGGDEDAPIRWGYLVVADESGTNEEPISERATIALTEHFATLRRVLDEVADATFYSGKVVVPEVGLGFAIGELYRLLDLDRVLWQPGRTGELERLIGEALATDGAHHKQWYIERIADRLAVATPPHEPGVAP